MGKIIAIIGAPGSGKSFLVHKLAEKLHALAFMEGEVPDFPPEIFTKLKENICDLEVFLWFRHKLIKEMVEAKKVAHLGKVILLDTFWKCSECYLDLIEDLEERKEASRLLEEDARIIPLPDKIILLKASEEKLREFMQQRGRSFENEETLQVNLFLQQEYERIFTLDRFSNLIIIDRDNLDFEKEEDLMEIIEIIHSS
jgi:deoxyadenosine/deoxycytidine kinase